jgi:hypothetical protein
MRIAETELAYFAGLFDGEGCVVARFVTHQNEKAYLHTFLSVTNKDLRPLDRLVELFGGKIQIQTKQGRSWGSWQISGNAAGEFAELIYPYSLIKADRLSLFIELRKLVGRRGEIVEPGNQRQREKLVALIDNKKEPL